MWKATRWILPLLCCASVAHAEQRSSLYPSDWTPGFTDSKGQYLHDFSYAGYHKSEVAVPTIKGPVTDVTQAPYSADPTGKVDASAAIQKALTDVGQAGGGVVYMPAGTYLLRIQQDKDYAVRMTDSHVVLRGAGMDKTKIYCDTLDMRQKIVVSLAPTKPAWWFAGYNSTLVTKDLLMPTTSIPVESAAAFKVGDLIAVQSQLSETFIDEVGMKGKWEADDKRLRGITLARRIKAIDAAANTITIDTPTRYPMRTRDGTKVYKITDTMVRESGFEDFSIAMKQNPGQGWQEADYDKQGTGAYQVHFACALGLANAEDCWVRGVGTFHPEGNDEGIDILSNGLRLAYCRQVTVLDCHFAGSQYRGGGGNGYLYMINGSDNLLRDNIGERGRHNFDFQTMSCTGNVLFNNTARSGSLPCDFHMYFSTANLIDSMTFDHDFFECRYRPYAHPEHGQAGSQNVFWNSNGVAYGQKKFIIDSRQFGMGYVIGTRGAATAVSPITTNFTELLGQGDALQPQSLWQDQLKRRSPDAAGLKQTGDLR